MQKNDVVKVTIEDIGVNGEGIGKIDGYTLFIKDAVIGDVVEAKIMKAKKNYGYARMIQIIEPSKDRVEPKCKFARQCGGCQIQQISYEKQLEFKNRKVLGNLGEDRRLFAKTAGKNCRSDRGNGNPISLQK